MLAGARGKLVQAVYPLSWKGLCTTTVIQVVWGPEKDPAINVPSDVVLDFLRFLDKNREFIEEVQEVWSDVRDHLMSGVRWLRVGGPMAATMSVLMDIGWRPTALGLWVDHANAAWHLDLSAPTAPLRVRVLPSESHALRSEFHPISLHGVTEDRRGCRTFVVGNR